MAGEPGQGNDPNDTMSVFWVRSEKADRVADTPVFGREWCPECEPDADPIAEILRTVRCERHNELPRGDADTEMPGERPYLSGSAESGDMDSRRMIRLLRGETDETPTTNLQTPEEA